MLQAEELMGRKMKENSPGMTATQLKGEKGKWERRQLLVR